MTSGADLFVVCKQCGSEVSPYITECPYCGHRLRRRAPKLPRAHPPSRSSAGRTRLGSFMRLPKPGARRASASGLRSGAGRWAALRPYATIALVAAGCLSWIAWHAKPDLYLHLAIVGPIQNEWWKLLTSELVYVSGPYAFVTLFAIAIFGSLIERRHGPAAVLALFFGAGVTGALAATAVSSEPIVSGGNGAALALIAAWAAPDLRAARTGSYYEGDLLGTAAIAALLLAIPFALRPAEASWLAGITGAAVGLVVGFGLHQLREAEL